MLVHWVVTLGPSDILENEKAVCLERNEERCLPVCQDMLGLPTC